jgi:hypothetical protein
MADIFISYSKADRDIALKLSALLESHGWSTWWDTSLEPADRFRDRIMAELEAARAVISIWTENSVKSDWVRAEAGRARQQDKLVPVRARGVSYADIPLPFGEMHTEDLANDEAVLRAMRGLLARPVVRPSMWRIGWASVRHEALVWFGIVGTVLTLVSNLRGLLTLAAWARAMVENWMWALLSFWQLVLSFLPSIRVGATDAVVLSIFAFLAINMFLCMKRREAQRRWAALTAASLLAAILAIFAAGYVSAKSFEEGSMLAGFERDMQESHWRFAVFVLLFWPLMLITSEFPMNAVTDYSSLFANFAWWAILIYLLVNRISGRRISYSLLSQRLSRIAIGIALVVGLNYMSLYAERWLAALPGP